MSQTHTLKVQGELSYLPDGHRGEFRGQSTIERSESNPQLSNIKFFGKFHDKPEYNDNFKVYNHFTKSAPIKAKDHLRVSPITVNRGIVAPNISPLTEYTDKFKVLNIQHVFPEYFESDKLPERAEGRSPILQISGNMDYNPEYR